MRGSVVARPGREGYSRPSVRAGSRRHHRGRATDRRDSLALPRALRPRPLPPPGRRGRLARRGRDPGRPVRRRLDRQPRRDPARARLARLPGRLRAARWPAARRTRRSSWPARSRRSTSTSSTRRTRSSSSRRSRSCPTRSTTSSGSASRSRSSASCCARLPWWAWPAVALLSTTNSLQYPILNGNSSLFMTAIFGLGIRYGWVVGLLAMKPTLAPLGDRRLPAVAADARGGRAAIAIVPVLVTLPLVRRLPDGRPQHAGDPAHVLDQQLLADRPGGPALGGPEAAGLVGPRSGRPDRPRLRPPPRTRLTGPSRGAPG